MDFWGKKSDFWVLTMDLCFEKMAFGAEKQSFVWNWQIKFEEGVDTFWACIVHDISYVPLHFANIRFSIQR